MFDRRRFLKSCTAAACLPATGFAAPAKEEEILAASDAIRNPARPFTTRILLVQYRNKKLEQEGSLIAYAKMNPERGQYDTLVRLIDPPRDRGKLMLKNGNELWFFDPATKSGMRISPQQRLLGPASNGDVVTVNLARDYKARIEAEETITDGERKDRACWRLKLTAANNSVVYPLIDYWIEQGSYRPVKSLLYSDSGRLLKTAFYRRYEHQLGRERPVETVIIDGVDTQLVTVMRYTDYREREIPDAWLTRDGLSQIPA
jgi:hypothetical protein